MTVDKTSDAVSGSFDASDAIRQIAGPNGQTLKRLAADSGVTASLRGTVVHFEGHADGVETFARVLTELTEALRAHQHLSEADLLRGARSVRAQRGLSLRELFGHVVIKPGNRKIISAKTPSQRHYVQMIESHDVVFGVGPAGTGKTYLAVAMAARALLDKSVKRIVLTRPAVEAGERLGFLPGDLAEKVDPYLRPLYDALFEMIGADRVREHLADGVIEIAPLAYMRGRTLSDAFVILDEAQNTTIAQLKMFLTRLGYGSRTVVTGDVTQTDLPSGQISGLRDAERRLTGVDGIAFARFSASDVVRHPLVERIIRAYEREMD